jgi:pimeloyl-ACP methyl ester carboxylesterase
VTKPATYVLVPGSWHGGWSWEPVAKRLRATGQRAITLTLPGLAHGEDPSGYGLQDAVDYVVGEVRRLSQGDVILVARSWGGYPATGAAHLVAERVSKVVYFNAQVPVRGSSLVDDDHASSPRGWTFEPIRVPGTHNAMPTRPDEIAAAMLAA